VLRAGRMEGAARGILNTATLVPNFADPAVAADGVQTDSRNLD